MFILTHPVNFSCGRKEVKGACSDEYATEAPIGVTPVKEMSLLNNIYRILPSVVTFHLVFFMSWQSIWHTTPRLLARLTKQNEPAKTFAYVVSIGLLSCCDAASIMIRGITYMLIWFLNVIAANVVYCVGNLASRVKFSDGKQFYSLWLSPGM